MNNTTSSSLVPFDFEGSQIRIFTDEQGDPWFVATDVCKVLGIGNPRQATTRLDHDERGVISTDTPGGMQAVATVNEPGLYSLVFGSRKPEAKRFKRWVSHEVPTAIRRSGSYGVPGLATAPAPLPSDKQDSVGALLLIGKAVAQVPGVKPGIAMAATLTCIQGNTGLATETLRRDLPATDEPICSLNATGLGQLLGMKAKDRNQHLAACRLQIRDQRGDWELTDAGQQWAEAMPYCRGGHSGYQILWSPAVVDVVRELG
jgi:prophage antirepressor-like protein